MGTEGDTSGKRRRKYSPPVVASVAAAVLLAGGGGAYWAATAGGGSSGPAAEERAVPPPPLALDDDGGAGAGGSSGPPPGIAVGEPDPNGGGTRYRVEGKLPDGPARAPVYTAGRAPTAADVAALARALGVKGEPRKADGVWTVGSGAEPTLQVGADAPGDWTYALHGIPGGKPCVHPPGAGPEKDRSDDAPACPSFRDSHDRPGGSDPAAARPVSEDRARAAARPVLAALGLGDAKVDASRVFGAVRTVAADPVLGGLPTYGRQTVLRVGADGRVTDGAGAVVTPVKGAEYPLVGAARALDELNRRAGKAGVRIGGCATPVPADEGAGSSPGAAASGPGSPPCAGGTLPRASVPIRGATFALAARSVGGRPALVPSWLFEAAVPGGGKATVTVVEPAVDPKYLTSARGTRPAPGGGPGRAVPAQVTSYSADGTRLTLHFWGGVCSDYAASASAQSTAAVTVKVTGVEREPGRPCVLMARRFDRKVALDRPLDGRKVVDVVTGEPVPRG
ncbi:hypothetical protein J7W19_08570 [Streptomyces mobaraensis NBRC 13819 = DSM 40847]|uniref:Large membrane protein n=1 Tax=Streptomyces mobaraensis (strain ATCC 29032 / DSM 40847 / JCM 4168 / NBRC 13819 / NCIMB 11159 / IPCR 16-22) TaxID=1223523 RepID=M3A2I0_STRM1|nr:hypothetical protein [Streptomyces mobaraensis]EME99313.1 hypothetical protein H340_16771 [Streptomyces mobaraensis NBRC 13819 = DSM 40847]QTT73468.1 hypothetical protein J7W19_08570 [Streptomyces mobaraensis NBRC 13819 = DSM 40847]